MRGSTGQTAPRSSQRPFVLIVGVQFDETGEAAWEQAVQLARQGQAQLEVHLVHVIRAAEAESSTDATGQVPNELVQEAIERLQVFALNKVGTASQPMRHVHLHVGCGDVAQVLIQFAVDSNADAIAIGTHRRASRVIGTTATALFNDSPCSVLVMRPKDYTGRYPTREIVEHDPFPPRDILSYRRLSIPPSSPGEHTRALAR